jgi:hypothetical protein
VKRLFLFLLLLICGVSSYAQQNEFGLSAGGSTYFGDLNTQTSFNYSHLSFGAYYRYNYDSRLSLKLQASMTKLEANDSSADNYFQRQRNLSFYSNLFEVALTGEFNFLDYASTNPKYNFTPYLTTGIAILNFDPKTTYQGNEYRLQPIGTEGQGLPQYSDKSPYKLVTTAWVLGGGFKYRINRNLSTFIEIANRKTHSDYIDDASGLYPDRQILFNEGGPLKVNLSDRSIEKSDVPVGQTNKMRGDSKKRDDYLFFQIGVSITINTYKCPYQ